MITEAIQHPKRETFDFVVFCRAIQLHQKYLQGTQEQ